MKINRLSLSEGAVQARGLTVIIDVFRAFTAECYLFSKGVKKITAVKSVEQALAIKETHKEKILVGERDGLLLEGFHYGNSPHYINESNDLKDREIVHTTSAGTKGISLAKSSDKVITGSFVNARAIAEYIKREKSDEVSLVAMGYGGTHKAAEDELCADYIEALIKEEEFYLDDIKERLVEESKRFKREEHQDSQPIEDYYLCLDLNVFDFVIEGRKIKNDEFDMVRIDI